MSADCPDCMRAAMKALQMEGERDQARHLVSRSIQILLDVKVCLEDEDYDDALDLVTAATEGA